MKLDGTIFIVISDHPDGPYLSETDVARLTLVNVCKDLRDQQYADPIAVIELNPVTHFCRDATHDFQALLERPADLD